MSQLSGLLALTAGMTELPTLLSQEHIEAPYGTYDITNRYYWNDGLLMVPVANADREGVTPPEIIAVCAPYGIRVSSWLASRLGEKPQKPDPTPADGEEVFAALNYQEHNPLTGGDALTKLYRASGVYLYYMKKPKWPPDGQCTGGAPPVIKDPPEYSGSDEFDQSVLG